MITPTDLHPTVRRMLARSRRARVQRVRAAVRGLVVGPSGLADLALSMWAAGLAVLAGLAWLPARPYAPLSDDQAPTRTYPPARPCRALYDAHSVIPERAGPARQGPARRAGVSGMEPVIML